MKEMARKIDIDDKKIIEIARELFLQKGIRRTEMVDIAQRVKIGRSSLYRHFPSKDAIAFQIAMEVLDQINSPLTEVLPSDWDGYRKAEYCLKNFVSGIIEHTDEIRFLDEFDQIFTDRYPEGSMSEKYTEYNRQPHSVLVEYLQEGIGDGSIRNMENLELLEKTIVNTLMGTAQRVLPREEHLMEEQGYAREYLLYCLDLILDCLRPKRQ